MSLAKPAGHAFWQLGFRPFFLLASALAALLLSLWLCVWFGLVQPLGAFAPMPWHAHEMIYGYTTAVIAGFVLTAAQNWTGVAGVSGSRLKALVAVWLAGRLALLFMGEAKLLAAFVDLAFYPMLAWTMGPYLRPEDMKVERVFFLYFALYLVGNALMHLEAMQWLKGYGQRGALLGLHTTTLMIVFMGGRVIPFFTASERARAQPRTFDALEYGAHGLAWLFLVTQMFLPRSALAAAVAFLAAATHLLRLAAWQVRRVRRVPLLWVLHLAYLWVGIGFGLFGLVSLDQLPLGSAVHAFAVGALGAMTYGMVARVSLGHTGRRLQPALATVIGFVCIHLAALIRVFGPLAGPAAYSPSLVASGTLWILGFAILTVVYLPILTRPRVDGRPG